MEAIPISRARIVVLALAFGTLTITLVLFLLRDAAAPPAPEVGRLFALLVPFVGLTFIPLVFVVRRILLAGARKRRAENRAHLAAGRLPRELFQATVIGCAVAEGVGLLGAVGYFLGGSPWLLAAPVVAVAAILAQFPSATRFAEALHPD